MKRNKTPIETNLLILKDFFVENHWAKLLKSWSSFIDRLHLTELANVLDVHKHVCYQ